MFSKQQNTVSCEHIKPSFLSNEKEQSLLQKCKTKNLETKMRKNNLFINDMQEPNQTDF